MSKRKKGKIVKLRIILLIGFFIQSAFSMDAKLDIRLLLTTALVSNKAAAREEEYRKSLGIFAGFGYTKPYIVEGCKSSGPSILEQYTDKDHVHYFQGNNPNDINRGKFEGLSMLEGLQAFNFPDEAYVYKHTGRYFAQRDLAQVVSEYPRFDAYLRLDPTDQIILTVAYLFKSGKLRQMLHALDYAAMERDYVPNDVNASKPAMIEAHVTKSIKQQEQEKKLDVFYIDGELGVEINPGNSSTGLLSQRKRY